MASHIVSMPGRLPGCVVECGCYKGGSTANLSLACAMVGRRLHVFDSFEGLPATNDRNYLPAESAIHRYEEGMYSAALEEVQRNLGNFGDPAVCNLHRGWFSDTLPTFSETCVLSFVDVDLRSSLETCVKALWPCLVDGGYLFVHEARHREIADLFFDRDWWRTELGDEPPGLVGALSGLGLQPGDEGWTSFLGYTRRWNKQQAREHLG